MNSNSEIRLLALGQSLIEHDLRAHPYPDYRPLCERLRDADVCFSNLEGALPGEHSTATRQGVTFHGTTPAALDCLKEFSINLLALSNNHSFDWGIEGIRATIAATQQRGFICAGSGENIGQASAPAFLKSERGIVALIAFASQVPKASLASEHHAGVNHLCLNPTGEIDPPDRRRILESLERAKQTAAVVIAYQHDHYWETDPQVTPRWKKIWARECIDAGANLFISHGVPRLHGLEIYKRHPIFYGLGNFIFHTKKPAGHYASPAWESVIADCTFRDGELAHLRLDALALNEAGEPEDFFATRGRPRLAKENQARDILSRLAQLSEPYGTRMKIFSDYALVEF